MSSLKRSNGDDYPDAAGKHLADAQTLVGASRNDGAAYLAGYVVECALKSLLQVETEAAPQIHGLSTLAQNVAAACLTAGGATSRYVTNNIREIPAAAIAGWRETMRYMSPSMAASDAQAWVDEANDVYCDTIARMILDGVIS